MNKICPLFTDSNAIIFSSNDFFVPYLSVMIQSIIDNSSDRNFYDIIILHTDLTIHSQNCLMNMTDKKNFSIRFYNVENLIGDKSRFYISGKDMFSVESYFRLLIPYILSDSYRTALYLDGDMLAKTDIYEAFSYNLDGYALASTRDYCGLSSYYNKRQTIKHYRDCEIKLNNPNDYIIAGFLLLNLDFFRDNYRMSDILDLAMSKKWLQHDQDVLNYLFGNGEILLIDSSWDVMHPYRIDLLPDIIREECLESLKHPKIIHYGGLEKPWLNQRHIYYSEFWKVAPKTPFISQIIERTQSNAYYNVTHLISQGKINLKTLLKWCLAYCQYKLKFIKEYLSP